MKVLSQLSGGFDSSLSTILVAETGVEFATIFYDIGQEYLNQERSATNYVVDILYEKYPLYKGHYDVSLPIMLQHGDGDVPSEYIPVRNLVMAAHSANCALSINYNCVAVGSKTIEVRENDPYSFSDCSIEFFKKVTDLISFCSENKSVEFIMPLIEDMVPYTKREVINMLRPQLDITKLWSCYQNVDIHCGVCYHCVLLKEAGVENIFKK